MHTGRLFEIVYLLQSRPRCKYSCRMRKPKREG